MVRTVRVRLELEDKDFKQGLRDDAAALRTFDGEVRTLGEGAERTGVELKQTATEAKKLGDDVKQSSREVDGLKDSVKTTGTELDKTTKKTTGLGDETKKTKSEIVDLAKEIDNTKAALKQLSDEFGRSGQVDVDRVRSLRAELAKLTKTRDELNKRDVSSKGILGSGFFGKLLGSTIANSDIEAFAAKQGAQAGSLFGDGFLKGAGRILMAGGPVLIPAVAALVAFVGAAIAGATLGATGLGAIAAGLALQFNSPSVHAAAANLGAYVKGQLTFASAGFADQFVAGFAALKREAAPLFTDLTRGFQSLQPYVAYLLVRLGEGLAKLGPGLGKALQAAGPVLEEIGNDLPMLMASFGTFFGQVASGAKGGTEALHALLFVIASLISASGIMLHAFAEAFDAIVVAGDKVTGFMAAIPGLGKLWQPLHDYVHSVATSFDETGLSSENAARGVSTFSGDASSAADAVQRLNTSIDNLIGKNLSLDQAQIDSRQGLADFTAAVDANAPALGRNAQALDINSQAGRNIAKSMDEAIGKFQAERQAAIDHAGGVNASAEAVNAANQKYQQQVDELKRAAVQHGLTGAAVEAYARKYDLIPNSKSTLVEVEGLAQALGGLSSLGGYLNSLPSTKRISVVTTYYANNAIAPGLATAGNHIAQRWGGVYEKAATGLLREANTYSAVNPGRYMMAEPATGGEAFVPRNGDYGRSMSILSKAASWYGASVVPRMAAGRAAATTVRHEHVVVVQEPSGRRLAELLIDDSTNRGGTAFPSYVRQVANR